MIISSEITGKTYNTVEECLAAEKSFVEKKEELNTKKNEAYKKAIAACDEYLELCGMEIESTPSGGYVLKYHGDGSIADMIFEDILNTMLK